MWTQQVYEDIFAALFIPPEVNAFISNMLITVP